nr:MAG TPA: hypothetical protein [Bacteriophage sp.]
MLCHLAGTYSVCSRCIQSPLYNTYKLYYE